jgi:hypothetical protein
MAEMTVRRSKKLRVRCGKCLQTCWKRADASHGRNESFISNNAFIQEN